MLTPKTPIRFALVASSILTLGLCGAGCGAPDSGPILQSGPWFGYFQDLNQTVSGSINFLADADGKIHVHIEGRLADGISPFTFETGAAILREGSNFNVSGSVAGMPVSGYGRERVFTTVLEVAIPIDDSPEHRLLVGPAAYQFAIEAGVG